MSAPLPAALIGWPLLPLPDADGELHWPGLEESVRQSIRVILATRPGEQLMHPEFGGGLAQFVAEQNTLATRARMRERVAESLARWERRIAVERVEVWEVPERPSEVRVEVHYRILRTGAGATLAVGVALQG
jgi:phage baseplate assembly protein W